MPYSWGPTSTSRLQTCHPLIVTLFGRVIKRPDLPHDLTVVYGHRTHAEQAALYAKGRTAPGIKVTNAKPGQSKHNTSPSQAIDVVPFIAGKASPADWGPIRACAPFIRAEWAAMVAEGIVPAGVTLHWGGDWNGPPDGAHWEVRGV
jgi:peptidoglycan L-alanyl-D-glutamate endopeptidase CwlK